MAQGFLITQGKRGMRNSSNNIIPIFHKNSQRKRKFKLIWPIKKAFFYTNGNDQTCYSMSIGKQK